MEHNNYLIKALDAYPYDLENAIESLHYALSCEPENPVALCLMGRIYFDVYEDYETAIDYFEMALQENVRATQVYSHYLLALIDNEDFEKAEKFIDFALTVKGSDKGMLYARRAAICECQLNVKKAIKNVEKAKQYAFNNDFMSFLESFIERLEKKGPQVEEGKKEKKGKKRK